MSAAKVLVVEDEAITAEVIAEQLDELGYIVTEIVSSGTEAIASALRNPPNLVLMDIRLQAGDIDGITAASRIREKLKLPVVYLSAYSDDATLERAKLTEPFGYILKPFKEGDLRVTIETALHKHRRESQLVEQKQLLETILHSAADAVVATDQTGAIKYMNPAAEKLTGWSFSEAHDQSIVEVVKFVNEITGEFTDNPAMRVLQEGRVLYLDQHMALVARDTTHSHVTDSASPMTKDTGEINGVVVILADLSQRQQMQFSEKEIFETQQLPEEKSNTLATQQELNVLKSQLLSIIAHEYRTPLAVIQGSSEILRYYSKNLSPETAESYFERIQLSVERMNQLISDFLAFNQAEAGELPFEPSLFNVTALCRDLVEEQRLLLGSDYKLNFEYQSHSMVANLDEQLLHMIVSNLLTNAIKYSPCGGNILLSLWCEPEQIYLQVQDRGIGIPPAEQHKLFSAFFRASNVGSICGTGLGLSIVKKCVDLHRGQISFTSEVGVGTTFTVTLPFNTN
ncbi:MAG: response regulator [Symploca sp. SIO3C6]|uniref:histidine kinase n=1 Tax=Symploca sp. SIO1C4 TaxID=2607765 RepID=A0A6B3N621_9CYAN|nr:response regulator [Symploca sp. SIO3C6]NER29176.1 response regulator [Symploca sp. SIO1C4]NET06963.1 response regulator [Symploca sp. SIO2B6]